MRSIEQQPVPGPHVEQQPGPIEGESTLEHTDVEDLSKRIAALSEEIDEYRTAAEFESNRFYARHEDEEVPPEDVPYGEDLARTADLPDELARAECMLARHCSGDLSSEAANNAFEEVQGIAERVRSTLDDCTPLPPESGDDDE